MFICAHIIITHLPEAWLFPLSRTTRTIEVVIWRQCSWGPVWPLWCWPRCKFALLRSTQESWFQIQAYKSANCSVMEIVWNSYSMQRHQHKIGSNMRIFTIHFQWHFQKSKHICWRRAIQITSPFLRKFMQSIFICKSML